MSVRLNELIERRRALEWEGLSSKQLDKEIAMEQYLIEDEQLKQALRSAHHLDDWVEVSRLTEERRNLSKKYDL